MIDNEIAECFARARALWPEAKGAASEATMAEWMPSLRKFDRIEVIEAFRALAADQDRFPTLRQLLSRLWDRRRAANPGLEPTKLAGWRQIARQSALNEFDAAALASRKAMEAEVRAIAEFQDEEWLEKRLAEVYAAPGPWETAARMTITGEIEKFDWSRIINGKIRKGFQSVGEIIGTPDMGYLAEMAAKATEMTQSSRQSSPGETA